jgi:hypothetical protein
VVAKSIAYIAAFNVNFAIHVGTTKSIDEVNQSQELIKDFVL